jgi:Domain of unknown function (DUF4437)
MRRVAIVAALTVVLAAGASAQKPEGTTGAMKATPMMSLPSEAKWSPAPPFLPEGAEVTVLEGDPTQPGLFTLQLKMPDGYKVAPHWHSTDERQTLVKGSLMMGMGEKWNDSDLKEMTPGAFVMLPKHNSHYVVGKGETIVQVQATGPYDVNYINASDDPRKKK